MEVDTQRSLPAALAWFIRTPADVSCEMRKQLAKTLLRSSADIIGDLSCLKLRYIFAAEFRDTANTGYANLRLWTIIRDIYAAILCDTEHIEGNNNIVKHILKRCPGIAWALLSDRLTNNRKMRSISVEEADALVEAVAAVHDKVCSELKRESHDRWCLRPSDVTPLTAKPIEFILKRKLGVAEVHAAKISARIRKELDLQPTYRLALRFTVCLEDPAADPTRALEADAMSAIWMPVYKYARSHIWCVRYEHVNDDKMRMTLPIQSIHIVEIIAKYHTYVKKNPNDDDVFVDALKVRWDNHRLDIATIVGEDHVCEIGKWCPCKCAKRRRPAAEDGPADPGPGPDPGAGVVEDDEERDLLMAFDGPFGAHAGDGDDAPPDHDGAGDVAITADDELALAAHLHALSETDVVRLANAADAAVREAPPDAPEMLMRPDERIEDALLAMAVHADPGDGDHDHDSEREDGARHV